MVLEIEIHAFEASQSEPVSAVCSSLSRTRVRCTPSPSGLTQREAFAASRADLFVVAGSSPEFDPQTRELVEQFAQSAALPFPSWLPGDVSIADLEQAAGSGSDRAGELGEAFARLLRLLACARERTELGQWRDRNSGRYQLIFDHAGVGLALLSGNGRVLEANRALPELLGLRPDEVLGLRPAELVHPEDAALGAARLAELRDLPPEATTARTVEFEAHAFGPGGYPLPIEISLQTVPRNPSEPQTFVVQVKNVSARRARAAESERRHGLLESIRKLLAQTLHGRDADRVETELLSLVCRAAHASDGFLAVVERGSADEALHVHAVEGAFGLENRLPQRLKRAGVSGACEQALHSRKIVCWSPAESAEHGLPGCDPPDGALMLVPLCGEAGLLGLIGLGGLPAEDLDTARSELTALFSTASGVLDHLESRRHREQSERAMQRSERTLQSLMDNLPGMVFRCDADELRTLHFASRGARDLFGLSPDELVRDPGRTFLGLVNPEDRSAVLTGVQHALAERRAYELRYRVCDVHGSERWLWERGEGVWNEDGEFEYVEGFLTDVTEARRSEEERLRLEARVQHSHKLESLALLAGGIAHDLNNALLGVLGHAGMAARKVEADHPAAPALAQIESSALRAAKLAEQMLSFSGGGPIRPEQVELCEVVRNGSHVLERLLPKGARLQLQVPNQLPPVDGDPGPLREALVHLVSNAAEALDDGRRGLSAGTVTVSAEIRTLNEADAAATEGLAIGSPAQPGTFVALCVHDDGPGMDSTVVGRAFDPFFTTKSFGRGLGLSAVLGIARSHDAFVQLESIAGRGTTVRLLFPLAPVRASAPPPLPSLTSEQGSGGTILVVDDEEIVRSVASALLAESGYSVLTACDGREGVDMFERNRNEIRAVLLDLSMPRLGGEEALIEMRRIEPDARILLTSGYSEDEAMHRIAARRGVAFLKKPYQLDELVERLEEVLHLDGHPDGS